MSSIDPKRTFGVAADLVSRGAPDEFFVCVSYVPQSEIPAQAEQTT